MGIDGKNGSQSGCLRSNRSGVRIPPGVPTNSQLDNRLPRDCGKIKPCYASFCSRLSWWRFLCCCRAFRACRASLEPQGPKPRRGTIKTKTATLNQRPELPRLEQSRGARHGSPSGRLFFAVVFRLVRFNRRKPPLLQPNPCRLSGGLKKQASCLGRGIVVRIGRRGLSKAGNPAVSERGCQTVFGPDVGRESTRVERREYDGILHEVRSSGC
jgi:hypothetical protein